METSSWYAIKQRVAWHEQGVPVSDVCRYYGIIPPHRTAPASEMVSPVEAGNEKCGALSPGLRVIYCLLRIAQRTFYQPIKHP